MDQDTKSRQTARAQFNNMFAGGRSFSGNERNCCYLNTTFKPTIPGRFANISGSSGLDFPDDGRALAVTDWDQDGDLDLWTSNRSAPRLRFLQNNSPNKKNFLSFHLIGTGKETNRDAIGARVEVFLQNKTGQTRQPQIADSPKNDRMIKTVRAGEGFLSQSSKWVHFGIPLTSDIEKVIVRWPGGQQETFTNIEAGNRYFLVQHSGIADLIQPAQRKLAIQPGKQEPEKRSDGTFRMATRVEVPPLFFETWGGKKQPIRATKGEDLLIVFWASWCPSCLMELKDLATNEDQIRSSGLNILALSVNGLNGPPLEKTEASRILDSMGFFFRSGRADSALIQQLQNINILKTENSELPLPFSILLDHRNRLTAIHRGPVDFREILEMDGADETDVLSQFEKASTLGGVSLPEPVAREALQRAEADGRFKYGHKLQEAGLLERATAQYKQVLAILPESEKALNAAAGAHSEVGQFEAAKVYLKKILDMNPDSIDTHVNLGGIYLVQKKFALAKQQYDKAIELSSDDPQLYLQRSIAEMKTGQINEALEDLNTAIVLDPNSTQAYFQRGICLVKLGKTEEALQDFDTVVRREPQYGPAYKRRGIARLRATMYEKSLHDFSQAIKLLPPDAELYNNRGMAYAALNNFAFAINDYKQAIELNQNEAPQIFNNLAWLLATCSDSAHRDGESAIQYAKQACELSQWSYYGALDTLAAAYAESERFNDAVKWQKRAVSYAPEKMKADLKARLKLYENNKPYRTLPNHK